VTTFVELAAGHWMPSKSTSKKILLSFMHYLTDAASLQLVRRPEFIHFFFFPFLFLLLAPLTPMLKAQNPNIEH
jgi:hypothetical protein